MSDLAKRIDVHANAGLLIQQWQQAPRMRALVDALQGVMDDHLIRPLADMEERLRIDIAEGFWLDCIGERLMLPRPATDIANFAFFGFHGSGGVGFDQGPFATVVEALSTRVPVGDEFYRKLLMMRAETLLADDTVERLSDAVGHVFPGVSYKDGGDMTVEVQGAYQGLDSRSLLEALDIAGGLPSPAGVELSRVVWEYVVGGDCEGDEPPVVAGHTSSHTNVGEYERSDEQAHSGNHSWKITVAQGASDSASVFIGFNVAYADLLTMTQITFSAWVYVPASDLLLSDVELELMCGEVDSEGATTWENTRSENPTAYDSWEYLEATTTISAACQDIRLALRVTDRSAPHVLYWDDISFRGE